MRSLVLALPLLALATSAPATTWNVYADGSGDAPTIRAAADSSAPGDSILIHPGSYHESEISDEGTTFIGVGGASATILDGDDQFVDILTGRNIVVQGLHLTGVRGSGYGYDGRSLIVTGQTEIRDCVFDHSTVSLRTEGQTLVTDCVFERPEWASVLTTGELTIRGSSLRGTLVVGGQDAPAVLLAEDCLFEDTLGSAILALGSYQMNTEVTARRNIFRRVHEAVGLGDVPIDPVFVVSVEDNLFVENSSDESIVGPVAIGIPDRSLGWEVRLDLQVRGNTFARNDGIAVETFKSLAPGSSISIENNIFSRNHSAFALRHAGFPVSILCNDAWENETNWIGIPDPTGIDGNISEFPRYCAPHLEIFALATNSPCLPANNSCGVLMGAFGAGCGPVGIEPMSWGRIKGMYRTTLR